MRCLVTGARGQVGLDLIAQLRVRGFEVHASDIADKPPALNDVAWHSLDVTDAAQVNALVAELRPQRVFHLAAILSARGEEIPQQTYEVNQTGTYNVLEAARHHGVERLVFASTIAVFGPGLPERVGDDVVLQPTTMYGITKATGEQLGNYYRHRYGLDFRAVRFPGLISAVQPGGGTSDYALYMYVNSVKEGHYQAFCRPNTRIPLMYMPDAIRALLELGDAPRHALSRCTYNIAAFSPTAHEIAQSVRTAIPHANITFAPDLKRQAILDSWPRALDDTYARRDWKWMPEFDLAKMTKHLVAKLRVVLERE